MPVKKIAAQIKRKAPKGTVVLNDEDPADYAKLNRAFGFFVFAVLRDVLDLDKPPPEPLNLNKVHADLLQLKADRDQWRKRCENIEAAFNAQGGAK